MTDLTDAGETLCARFCASDEAVTRPTVFQVALYTVSPDDTGGGTEVSGNGYARQTITLSDNGSGIMVNDADITFTSTGSWGNVICVGLFGDSTLLFYKAITSISVTTSGQSLIIDAGDLSVRFA